MTGDGSAEDGQRPSAKRVAEHLRAEIDRGTYAQGERLPSYRDLATTWGVAMGTAREAIRLLEQDGRAVVRHGSGVYVREVEPGSAEQQLIQARETLTELRGQFSRIADAATQAERRINETMERIQPGSQPRDG